MSTAMRALVYCHSRVEKGGFLHTSPQLPKVTRWIVHSYPPTHTRPAHPHTRTPTHTHTHTHTLSLSLSLSQARVKSETTCALLFVKSGKYQGNGSCERHPMHIGRPLAALAVLACGRSTWQSIVAKTTAAWPAAPPPQPAFSKAYVQEEERVGVPSFFR